MDSPSRHLPVEAVVLWRSGGMTCTCRSYSPDRTEICLVVAGAIVERQIFTDAAVASQFAIDKMHVYDGLPQRSRR